MHNITQEELDTVQDCIIQRSVELNQKLVDAFVADDQDEIAQLHTSINHLQRVLRQLYLSVDSPDGQEQRLAMVEACRVDNGNKLLAAENRIRKLEAGILAVAADTAVGRFYDLKVITDELRMLERDGKYRAPFGWPYGVENPGE